MMTVMMMMIKRMRFRSVALVLLMALAVLVSLRKPPTVTLPANDPPVPAIDNASDNGKVESMDALRERLSKEKRTTVYKAIENRKYNNANVTDNLKHLIANRTHELNQNYTRSTTCLTSACIDQIAKPLSRAFPSRPNKDEWCFARDDEGTTATSTSGKPDLEDNPLHQGLILVKVPKSASSTTAAAVLRLGHQHHCNMSYIHWEHRHAHKEYAKRNKQRSVMILTIRDPAHQRVSQIFWTYATLRAMPRNQITAAFLVRRSKGVCSNLGCVKHNQGGIALQFAALEEIHRNAAWDIRTEDLIRPQDTIKRVKAIMQNYDFMLVVERLDESLVALALLLDVPVTDVVVSSSKVAGGKNKLPYVYSQRTQRCFPMAKTFVPPELKRYLDSDVFRSQSYGDLILHAAANMSLDLTIESLGKERFQAAMTEYLYWKKREREECASQSHFPCSSDGKVQLEKAEESCYSNDMGCGYKCFDDMLAKGKTDL